MKLSAPIYHLKRRAKLLSRELKIPLHEALDRIATEEGFHRWSLLSACAASATAAARFFAQLRPGDIALIGARPGHGKTLMGIEILVEAMKAGHRAAFFTFEFTEKDVSDLFRSIGVDMTTFDGRLDLDTSDTISADSIMKRLAAAPAGTTVLVDYLQLLDQQRHTPALAHQVQAITAFARDKGIVVIFLSQIDRSYDSSRKPCPDIEDLRLPNPLDVKVFTKTCFLHEGTVRLQKFPI
jgi:replicative DNA helicase